MRIASTSGAAMASQSMSDPPRVCQSMIMFAVRASRRGLGRANGRAMEAYKVLTLRWGRNTGVRDFVCADKVCVVASPATVRIEFGHTEAVATPKKAPACRCCAGADPCGGGWRVFWIAGRSRTGPLASCLSPCKALQLAALVLFTADQAPPGGLA
jgi:hypothetical protein